MSKGSSVYDVLGASPFDALNEHMVVNIRCVNLLSSFFDAVFAQDWPSATEVLNEIHTLESEADFYKRQMRLTLHKGLLLPVPRMEILDLLSVQDRIANRTEDVAGLVLGRNIVIPKVIEASFKALIGHALQTCLQAQDAVQELTHFFASGFSDHESSLLEKMLEKVAAMEKIADTCEIEVRSALLSIESELPAVEVMFLYEVIGLIGHIADAAESVSDRLSLLLAQ